MKFKMKRTTLSALLALALTTAGFIACTDDFTEEDALNAQQTIDLSIYVIDYFDAKGLSDAQVSLVRDGSIVSVTTNEEGIAIFSGVKIGTDIPVTVEKDGFTKIQTNVDVDVENFRQGHITETIGVLSLTENTAVIKGKLEIETDLTNDETEVVPEGTEVNVYLSFFDAINDIEVTAATDAAGNYELVVPAINTGVSYEVRYPTLVLDQTIAKNRNTGEPEFPETLPGIDVISTTFNPRGSAVDVPQVPAIVATVPAPANGKRAVLEVFGVNSDGEITNIDVDIAGAGYTGAQVPVTIISLFGGSGADVVVPVNPDGTLSFFDVINDGGSGYPDFQYANRSGKNHPKGFEFFVISVQSGEIRVINVDYGTGTYRDKDIE